MARVPITVLGFRCERCNYEWLPRGRSSEEPRVCPRCKSPYWNKPRKKAASMLTYDDFKAKIADVLKKAGKPITWTEVRTAGKLPEKFPNNRWVRRLEADIGLQRNRDEHGIIQWSLR